MTQQTKAVVKGYFSAGDKPTQQNFEDLVDSYQDASSILTALASGNSGIPVVAASALTMASAGTFGQSMLATDTTAEAQDVLALGSADSPTFKAVTLGDPSVSAATLITFDGITGNFPIKYEDTTIFGNDPAISIAASASDVLKVYVIQDTSASGPGTRLAVWNKSVALPDIPHTGVRPTFAVYGDILVGDIVALERNPMTYFVRTETGLSADSVTQLFSAKEGAADTDGGAHIVYAPSENSAGSTSDGYIDLIAYGKGGGTLANTVSIKTRSAADTATRRWVFQSAGHFVPAADETYDIGTTANLVRALYTGQIGFPATPRTSTDANTLDAYAEGTWTPVLTFATPGDLSVAYAAQTGSYTRIGRHVFVTCNLVTSTFTHSTASGALRITGLPFSANSGFSYSGATSWGGITKASYTQIAADVQANQSYAEFVASGSGVAASTISASDMPTGGTVRMNFTLSYHV